MRPVMRSDASGARSWPHAGGWILGPARARDTAASGEQVAWASMALRLSVVIGLLLRLTAAGRLTSHVDEAASVLAAHMVAERGLPILPSGTVYLQGATLSYLLAPLVWFGKGGLHDLTWMRLVSVLAGTISIYLGYRLTLTVTRDARIGVITAALIALDPLSVQWSGHVRMYSLLQAVTLALIWLYIRVLAEASSRRLLLGMVAVFWFGIFTHVGTALLLPVMALVAFWHYRWTLFSRRRDLTLALVVCGLAPVVLVGLNGMLGTASVGGERAAPSPFLTFVGDNLIAPLARLNLRITPSVLASIFRDRTLAWLIPALIVAVATLVVVRHAGKMSPSRGNPVWRPAVVTIVAVYWFSVVAVGIFTVSPKERYLLHVHVLGYVLVAAILVEFLSRRPPSVPPGWRRRLTLLGAYGLTPLVGLGLITGLFWRLDNTVVHPDYPAALTYVATHRDPGEPVIAALPAIAYLLLDGADDLQFLAGPEDRPRAQRYTRPAGDGQLSDYWAGVPSIVSPVQLCSVVQTYPDAWIVVDEERLNASWAYAGPMADTARAMTYRAFVAPGGAVVLRPGLVGAAGNPGCGLSG